MLLASLLENDSKKEVDCMTAYQISSARSGEEIYKELRDGILSLEYKPGQLLSENAVAARYQVSRSPIRGVFNRLANENLLEIRPQKGSYVTLLDYEYIREIIYIRTMVEQDILTQTIKRVDDNLLGQLTDNLQQQEKLALQGSSADLRSYYHLDTEFHHICFRHLGRETLWQILQESQVHYKRFRMLDIISQQILERLLDEHRTIYAALLNRDIKALTDSLKSHLADGMRRIEMQVMELHPEYFINKNPNK